MIDRATALEALRMAEVGLWEWNAADAIELDAFMTAVVPDDRRALKAAIAAGGRYDLELRVVGDDGKPQTVHAVGHTTLDAEGRPVRVLATAQDITDRKRSEAALSDSERRFRAAFEDAAIGMCLVAADGSFIRVNRAVAAILGRTVEEVLSLTFQDVTHPDDLAADVDQVERLLAGAADSYSMEKRYLRPGGEVVWALLTVSIVRDPDGSPEYFVSQIQDVSEERRLREHLHHLADHDSLTGMRNRRRFDEDLAVQASRAGRYGEPAAIVVFDLDGFKAVNDTHGHAVGDEVLCRVAEVIDDRLRRSDSSARIGGDEFALLLVNARAPEAERIAADIALAIRIASGHDVSASWGVACLEPGRDPSVALRDADRAMYRAKAATATPAGS